MVGTITYDATNNIVNVVGGTAQTPVGFVNLWNADKAGNLSLHARTGITGVDGANVALTRNARPTDRVVLGGAKQDLFIVVSAWTNMTSATVQLIGTDSAGNVQTEDLAITGNGTVYAAKYFATLTHSKVTAWVGTGSFAYEVMQAQWGVVWKQATNQFAFNCKIVVGNGSTATFFADAGKQIMLMNGVKTGTNQIFIDVSAKATAVFGTLQDVATRTTSNGCQFIDGTLNFDFWGYVIRDRNEVWRGVNAAVVYLYSCSFFSLGTQASWFWGERMWNIQSDGCAHPYNAGASNSVCDIFNVIISGKPPTGMPSYVGYGLRRPSAIATISNLFVSVTGDWLWFGGTSGITVKNAYCADISTNMIYFDSGSSGDFNCINIQWTANWRIYWAGTSSGARVNRQYEFDLVVTDASGNPVQDATVSLKDKNGAQIFSASTDVNGRIATQTVTRGYYQQSTGNTLQDSSPHTLTIGKAGYQNYTKKFTLQEKTKWEIKLAKTQVILLDMGKPVVNLRVFDPENKHVLQL